MCGTVIIFVLGRATGHSTFTYSGGRDLVTVMHVAVISREAAQVGVCVCVDTYIQRCTTHLPTRFTEEQLLWDFGTTSP